MLNKVGRFKQKLLSVARALKTSFLLKKERVRFDSEISDEIANGDGGFIVVWGKSQ